jgi:hypothetical protein
VRELIVVDGFNVLHAGVLRGRDRAGWWRPEARAKLLAALAPLAGGPAELRVVFDARGDASEEGAPIGAGGADWRGADTSSGGAAAAPADSHSVDWRKGNASSGVETSAPAGGGDEWRQARASNGAEAGPGAGRVIWRRADASIVAGAQAGGAGGTAGGAGHEIPVILAPDADDRIVEEVLREAPRRSVTVVTSDRGLARRARQAGAAVVGAGAFLAGLTGPD